MTEVEHRAFFVNVRRFDIALLLGPTGELCFVTGRGEDIPAVLALENWAPTTQSGERQVSIVAGPDEETAALREALTQNGVTFSAGAEITLDGWHNGDTIYLYDPEKPGRSGHDLFDLLVGYIDVWSTAALVRHAMERCPMLALQAGVIRPRLLIIAGVAPQEG